MRTKPPVSVFTPVRTNSAANFTDTTRMPGNEAACLPCHKLKAGLLAPCHTPTLPHKSQRIHTVSSSFGFLIHYTQGEGRHHTLCLQHRVRKSLFAFRFYNKKNEERGPVTACLRARVTHPKPAGSTQTCSSLHTCSQPEWEQPM